jgi:sulfur-oxidizing protein SoxB
MKTGKPLDADKKYVVAGWASINQSVEGPPIWDVVQRHLADVKTVRLDQKQAVVVRGA